MIHHVLVRGYVKQGALLFVSLAFALFAFAWIWVWVVGLVDMSQFQTVLEQFRAFERFAPIGFDSLFTYQGRVGLTFDEPVVILCIVVWCLSRGSDVVSGGLGRGTLEMVLSQPVSRAQVLWSHAAVSVAGLAMLVLFLWAGLYLGINTTTVDESVPRPSVEVPFFGWDIPLQFAPPETESFPLSDRVDPLVYLSSAFSLFAFGFFVLGLSTLFSSLDRYRWRTVGGVMAVYVVQLVLFGLGKAADSLAWLQQTSFFNCYRPQKLLALTADGDLWAPWGLSERMPESMFPPLAYPMMLLLMGGACYLLAARIFSKRDLPAPL